jgi:hypothetical protein
MFGNEPPPGARRCSTDGINFPNHPMFNKCPVCGENTWIHREEDSVPDYNWRERTRELLGLDTPIEGEDEVPEGVLQLTDMTVIELADGLYGIDSRDVVNNDVRHRLNPCDVVRIGRQLFEILGYSYARREYVISPLGWTDEGLEVFLGRQAVEED